MDTSFNVIGIGASAGGIEALQEFFKNVPPKPNAAFIVVTHLFRWHRTQLDLILSKVSSLPVTRIVDGEPIVCNHIYVLPENMTLEVSDGKLCLHQRNDAGVNRAVDIFFKSLAEHLHERAVAVVLSGGGTDGSKGVAYIHDLGGRVYVQDPASSAFSTMPQSAIASDHPEAVKTPAALAKEIVEAVQKETATIPRRG